MNTGDLMDDSFARGSARGRWIAAAIVAVVVAVLGVLPMRAGLGPFGIRIITAPQVDVHVLNLSGQDLEISLPMATPKVVKAGTLETVTTLGGPVRLQARTLEGELFESLEFQAHGTTFYNAGGGKCFAVLDLTSLYGGGNPENVSVAARLDEDTRIYAFEADTIILPRRMPPSTTRGTVHWIEPVACSLLQPEEEGFLIGRSMVRLQDRQERYEAMQAGEEP